MGIRPRLKNTASLKGEKIRQRQDRSSLDSEVQCQLPRRDLIRAALKHDSPTQTHLQMHALHTTGTLKKSPARTEFRHASRGSVYGRRRATCAVFRPDAKRRKQCVLYN